MATRQSLPEIQTNLFIDGQWVEGAMDKKAVINPATGEELVQVSQGGKEETNRAIEAAKKLFRFGPVWN